MRAAEIDEVLLAETAICLNAGLHRFWKRGGQAMRQRRETVELPFGTMKARMGATHSLMKRLPKVATEMALHVLAYNLTRVMNIIGVMLLIAAMGA
jgi:Transposase DDE domain